VDVERAWEQFTEALGGALAQFGPESILIIDTAADDDAATPFVQFAGLDDDRGVRMEVSDDKFLDPAHHLGDDGHEQLRALGFTAPHGDEHPNPYLDREGEGIGELATIAARVLREVIGVAHPSQLQSGGPGSPDAELDPSLLVAVQAQGADHLRQLVDEALTPLFDGPPPHDADGDIPVVAGSSLVFVRVRPNQPVIELFSILVQNVANPQQAAIETTILNRDADFIRYLVAGDRILARVCVPAFPFLPIQLRWMLGEMARTLDEVDDDLALRVGGTVWRDPQAVEGGDGGPIVGVHPAVATLRELEAETPGSVDADLAARVCGHDQNLILRLIDWAGNQEEAWRKTREEALQAQDGDTAETAKEQADQAEHTASILRRALRVVVTNHPPTGPDGTPLGTSAYNAPGYL
ncbi:MAG: hypothetical protein GX643_05030, partial [Acidimicrobiales bacterium]|nr:hypothetical protein [Acidimicrobiales bacterium]